MSSRFDASKCVPAPDEEMLCTICHDILDVPMVTPCQHIFCRVCITRTSEMNGPVCPTCREDFDSSSKLKKPMPMIVNMINKLTMKCVNEDKGCTDLITVERYLDHTESCPYTFSSCEGCNKAMLRRDLAHHKDHQCPKRDVPCEKCGLAFPWALKGTHECLKSLAYSIKELALKNDTLEQRISEQDKKIQEQEEEIEDLKAIIKAQFSGDYLALPDELPE